MKLLAMFLLLCSFAKSIYYGLYEINEKKNKPGGIVIIFMTILGLALPFMLLIFLY